MEEHDLSEQEESFADMFAQSEVERRHLSRGEKVEGVVVKITADCIFLDIGQKGEGVIERRELEDETGELPLVEGERLSAYFISSRNGEFRLSTRLAGGGSSLLEEAHAAGIPVEGRVEKEVKGGYEVRLSGQVRAFCPFSQIDLRRGAAPESWIGETLPFRISQYGEGGRNIVVSRRALLEEEQAQKREALRESLSVGETITGVVTSLQKFGVFVDIGGVEGLVPMSELAWGRIEDASEVVTLGAEVEVVVKSLDWEANRFSFSIRETLSDPWQTAASRFPSGTVCRSKVVRLAPFGAFVNLDEGIDGLLHISVLGQGKRINHPREVVQEGDTVEVMVDQVDSTQHRISLKLAAGELAAAEEAKSIADFSRQQGGSQEGFGTMAALFAKAQKKPGKNR
ncbi:MAG: 30S ribosomal protein S1 [Desulfuromonas sp.]|nr:MAG: 30S ribosomal protein S1 [Desulfuromonas sp.]